MANDFELTFLNGSRAADDATIDLLGAAVSRASQPESDRLREARKARESLVAKIRAGQIERGTASPPPDDDTGQAERLRDILAATRATTGQPVLYSVVAHPGLTTISAPYDYMTQWMEPGSKPPRTSIGDPAGGLMTVAGESSFPDDGVNAVAGVGFVLDATAFGLAEVRPYITYSWHYSNLAAGAFSHAEASGGVELAAWRVSDGSSASLGGVRRKQLFRDAVSPGEFHDYAEDGTVISSDISVDIQIQPGESYWVNLGAWVVCNHDSGVTLAPTTTAFGEILAHVGFVVIQRYT